MSKIDPEIGMSIIRLLTAFPDSRRDMKLTTGIYSDGLVNYAGHEIRAAVDRAIRECKFFPAVAELRVFADEARNDKHHAAQSRSRLGEFIAYSTKGDGLKREGEGDTEMVWRIRVRHFRDPPNASKPPYWPDTFGPTPEKPGCHCPEYILREFDYRKIPEDVPADKVPWPAELTALAKLMREKTRPQKPEGR